MWVFSSLYCEAPVGPFCQKTWLSAVWGNYMLTFWIIFSCIWSYIFLLIFWKYFSLYIQAWLLHFCISPTIFLISKQGPFLIFWLSFFPLLLIMNAVSSRNSLLRKPVKILLHFPLYLNFLSSLLSLFYLSILAFLFCAAGFPQCLVILYCPFIFKNK